MTIRYRLLAAWRAFWNPLPPVATSTGYIGHILTEGKLIVFLQQDLERNS